MDMENFFTKSKTPEAIGELMELEMNFQRAQQMDLRRQLSEAQSCVEFFTGMRFETALQKMRDITQELLDNGLEGTA